MNPVNVRLDSLSVARVDYSQLVPVLGSKLVVHLDDCSLGLFDLSLRPLSLRGTENDSGQDLVGLLPEHLRQARVFVDLPASDQRFRVHPVLGGQILDVYSEFLVSEHLEQKLLGLSPALLGLQLLGVVHCTGSLEQRLDSLSVCPARTVEEAANSVRDRAGSGQEHHRGCRVPDSVLDDVHHRRVPHVSVFVFPVGGVLCTRNPCSLNHRLPDGRDDFLGHLAAAVYEGLGGRAARKLTKPAPEVVCHSLGHSLGSHPRTSVLGGTARQGTEATARSSPALFEQPGKLGVYVLESGDNLTCPVERGHRPDLDGSHSGTGLPRVTLGQPCPPCVVVLPRERVHAVDGVDASHSWGTNNPSRCRYGGGGGEHVCG